MPRLCAVPLWLLCVAWTPSAWAESQPIPHAQDKPPNEPRDPVTAAKMMTVPEGFVVDVVAAEPDIVNPVSMTFDEQGRVWITESLEYPRKDPGPGKDRVKILEDTDGDGKMDKFSIFLDGLNIPSGVAVGHGGVWIANSPDILFVPDKDRDGKPDGEPQVVVTGFGRTDTHELPNSLTWGPDGWLYGLNGVFNHSHVKYSPNNPNFEKAGGDKQPGWPLTCAMFRIHPRTWEFQVFAEGTSNPWGIAFNDEGDAFVSACVIDHLWHIVETGYYHRQGGPYPPHTWKIESIVEHKHQKAAYCGITWFDSDAYPEKYRKRLYMGNIHGGCINVDRLERNGSTYKGFGEPDFLTANDAWFMPVVQKTGPDGCLWILDWYDRYHCYQDANRDPAGIDRLKGRLYRVRYEGESREVPSRSAATRGGSFDLAKETDDQLIEKLGHPNVWMRETAQRVLQERNDQGLALGRLFKSLTDNDSRRSSVQRRHTLFAMTGISNQSGRASDIFETLRDHQDPFCRAWAIRYHGLHWYGDDRNLGSEFIQDESNLAALLLDESPPVRLQAAILVGKHTRKNLQSTTYGGHLARSLLKSPEDAHMARILWQALKTLLNDSIAEAGSESAAFLKTPGILNSAAGSEIASRIADWHLSQLRLDFNVLNSFLNLELQDSQPSRMLASLSTKIQSGELAGDRLAALRQAVESSLATPLKDASSPHHFDAMFLALSWKDRSAVEAARHMALNDKENPDRRVAALNALIAAQDAGVLEIVQDVLHSQSPISNLQSQILQSLGKLDDPKVAEIVLADYAKFPAELQPKAIELLTQRASWAKSLLRSVGEKKIQADAINVNQARRLRELKDEELSKLLKDHWGEIRDGRNPDREKIVAEMKAYIREHQGDEANGEKVFKKVCGQCHKLYGEGAEVGPDITRNGRNDYQQLLSNVFDPSLVIGAGYRSYTVLTNGGRVVNGLLVEESPQRVVLKVQGGKQEIIPREDIDVFKVNELSLMPEQLEKQITLPEIADLFAYITLDKSPGDTTAKRLAGVYEAVSRETLNPDEFGAVFQEVAPGFTSVTSGERGVGLVAEHQGKKGVVRTHPVSKDKPAIMKGKFAIPKGQKTTLVLDVSHDERGDWRLIVAVGGAGRLLDEMISKESCPNGWSRFHVDLTKFAGEEIEVQLFNQANNWAWEFGYWGAVKVVSE